MKPTLKKIAMLAAVSCVVAILLTAGYVAGERSSSNSAVLSKSAASESETEKTAIAEADKIAAEIPIPPAPLALPAMRKAVVLEGENPDAFRAQYLDKRYRVVGRISSIIGTTQSQPDQTLMSNSGTVFRLDLQEWDLQTPDYGPPIPDLAFPDLPTSTRLTMRPGQEIDADCILTKPMTFAYCELNKPPQ